MPIEPTNVSKQQVREVEPTSASFGSWTSMQGSSTGGKDRPLNSLWEKAINGAQKLFGSEMSEPASLEEKGEKEDRSEAKNTRTSGNDLSFEAPTSFMGRRFGSFGGAAFGGNTFGTVVTSRAAPDTSFNEVEPKAAFDSPKAKSEPKFGDQERPAEKVNAASQQDSAQKGQSVSEDGSEEEVTSKEKRVDAAPAKPAQRSAASQPLAVPAHTTTQAVPTVPTQESQTPPVVQPSAVTTANQAQSNPQAPLNNAQPKQQGAAQSAVAQATLSNGNLNTQNPSDASKVQLPTQASQQAQSAVSGNLSAQKSPSAKADIPAVQTASTPATPSTPAQETKTVPAQVASAAAEKPQPAAEAAPKADAATVKPSVDAAQTKEGIAVTKDAKDSLGLDTAKAKEAVSEAFAKASTGKPLSQATQATTTSPQQVAVPATTADSTPKAPVGEFGSPRPGDTGASEAKDISNTDTAKRDLAAAAQQRTANAKGASEGSAQARAGAQEAAGFDAKLAQTTASAKTSGNQFAREAAMAAAANRTQPTSAQSKGSTSANTATTTGVNGVTSGPQSLANGATAQGAQQGNSQNSGGDPAAKQDFGSAMKQAANSKGGEKSLDGGQSFEAKVEAAANRRSEAASKARQTSYVSKTAAEVKEVVATLTKSIDRLVTDKSGAMNLKVNFEGGGSLKLSVSMDGSKVATSMQTDVVGLEAAIKANWGELANDWNQKGVKLNTPQFQNSEMGKNSSFDDLSEFASKQERNAEGKSGEGRGRGNGQAAGPRGFSSENSAQGEANESTMPQRETVVSDKELKTYA